MDTPAARGIGSLHHIGIAVPDLQPAAQNLRALLAGSFSDGGEDDELAVAWTWIESEGNPIVELLAPTDADGPVARWLAHHGQGLHHVSFMPSDLDVALEHTHACCVGVLRADRSHTEYEQFFVDPKATGGALFHAFRFLNS